jgi:hypothetical protein
MSLRTNAEGGVNGANVTTANSGGASGDAWTTVSGQPKYTSASITGSMSILLDSFSTTQFVGWDEGSASASWRLRFCWVMPSLPGANHQVVAIRSLSGALGSLQITGTGAVQAFAGASSSAASAGTMTAGATKYRIEAQGTGWGTASSTFDIQVYDSPTSMSLVASATLSGATTSDTVQRARFGKPSGSATLTDGTMDDWYFETGNSTPVGPVAESINAAAGVASATGTAFDADPTEANSSISVSVDAQTAFASGSAPFNPSGTSIGLDYLVTAANEAFGAAFDITPKVSPGPAVAAATGAAFDAVIAQASQVFVQAGVASGIGVAHDAQGFILGQVSPPAAEAIGEAFDATVVLFVEQTFAMAETAEGVGTVGDPLVDAINNTPFFFTTPTFKERWHGRHGLWSRMYLDRGISILRFGDSFQQIDEPTAEQVEEADVAFIGGRTYPISAQDAQRLRLAGYGRWVTENEFDPIPEVDISQFGAGPYGTGPYGV